jgi:Zn-dependent M28 family amino/carboxypeptidase
MLEHLRAQGAQVTPHSFRIVDPYDAQRRLRLTNIKASFRPEETRRIALAAHWDCRPAADRDPDPEKQSLPVPGANDSASGVAVLLTLAEIFASHAPPVGVDLLFFDGEDYGREGDPDHYLLGSRQFVVDFARYRPEALVLLDMVGDADLSIPMEGFSLQNASDLTRRVFTAAQRLGLPAFVPQEGRALLDDHVPFLRAGIPAVDLIDFDYKPWHTTADLPDACSAESLGQVGRLMLALLFEDFAN